MRKIKIAILVFILFIALTGIIAADNSIKVIVNGTPLNLDVQPAIQNGRTLLPVRAIFEALNAEVSWDGKNKIVTGVKADIKIELTIDKKTAKKNGNAITLDTPATIINGRTLVPIRFIAESLGCEVKWDGNRRMVIIESAEDGQNNVSSNSILKEMIKDTWFWVDDGSAIIEITDNEFRVGWAQSEWDEIWTYTIKSINEKENMVEIIVNKDKGVKEKYIIKLYTVGESRVSMHLIDENGEDTMWMQAL